MEQKKLKVGVFGVWRGQAYINAVNLIDEAEIVAILDKDEKRIEEAKKLCPADVKICKDFDELLSSGIDAVVLSNYFHEHAAYAIRAMKAGIHVMCETQPAVTMKECVELAEAVEETGCIFSLAENYPFFRSAMELARVYKSGILGDVIYADGEYCHPTPPEMAGQFAAFPDHWRNHLPRTFYHTHAMAPLMAATDLLPRRVIGKVVKGESYARRRGSKGNPDAAGVMLVEMDGGVVFRITGCSCYGPEANWYRLACERGGVESVRGKNDTVQLSINPWDVPESLGRIGHQTTYIPVATEEEQVALRCGHGGGDFWVTKHFVEDVLANRPPYFDIYRSLALTAVGILGWRSVLDGSKQYDIPDFRDKEAREIWRSDDRSPFPGEGRTELLPSRYYTVD